MIKRLYADNYRCFVNFTLDLSGNPSTLLIGRNGAGKSTLLAALRLFQGICREGGRTKERLSRNDFTWWEPDRPMRLEIDLQLGGKRHAYAVAFDWPERFREARITAESLRLDGEPVFERELADVQLAGGPAFRVDWHVFALPVVQEPGDADAIGRVRRYLAAMTVVEPVPTRIGSFSEAHASELDREALALPACIEGLVRRTPAAYAAMASALKDTMPQFSSMEFRDHGEGGSRLVTRFEEADPASGAGARSVSADFGVLSSGEKCLFLAAWLIARRDAGDGSFVAWDEPDNHLALPVVADLIRSLRRSSGAGGSGQFLATSHHPTTIRSFTDENTVVLQRHGHLDPARPRTLSEVGYDGDLIEALTLDGILDGR